MTKPQPQVEILNHAPAIIKAQGVTADRSRKEGCGEGRYQFAAHHAQRIESPWLENRGYSPALVEDLHGAIDGCRVRMLHEQSTHRLQGVGLEQAVVVDGSDDFSAAARQGAVVGFA